ncbi:MAG TPA: hypothetical protein VF131_15450 [Blastocatellia bacterium]|nr:hypothetical protein [Blastocatellia bacterium]
MFQMARDNLEDPLMIRSNDPQAHLYYGKVLKLTARTGAEKQRALPGLSAGFTLAFVDKKG